VPTHRNRFSNEPKNKTTSKPFELWPHVFWAEQGHRKQLLADVGETAVHGRRVLQEDVAQPELVLQLRIQGLREVKAVEARNDCYNPEQLFSRARALPKAPDLQHLLICRFWHH